MPSFGTALAWMIISPIAFFTDFLGILVILHYKPLFHSCDVAFISIFVTMTTNAWLLLPVPAVVTLGDIFWSKKLCSFYTWLSITLRTSHLLVLLVLNMYWMASLRVSRRGQRFGSAKAMKVCVCVCWFVSVTAGVIPVAGGADIFDYYQNGVCKFLPRNVSVGFAVAFILASFLSLVMGLISNLDMYLVLRNMRNVALTKYHAGRVHISTVSGRGQAGSQIHARYSELNASLELCRLVLWYTATSATLNALPLLISQFIQLLNEYNREILETTLLWLLLFESLILPHLLWLLSKRYRHATIYTWKVFVIRDHQVKEEDSEACIPQSYRFTVRETDSRPYMNGDLSMQVNGSMPGSGIEDLYSEVTYDRGRGDPLPNGFNHVSTPRENSTLTTGYDLTLVRQPTFSGVGVPRGNHDSRRVNAMIKGQGYSSGVHETSFTSMPPRTKTSTRVVVSDAEIHHSTLRTFPSKPLSEDFSGDIKRSVPEVSGKSVDIIPADTEETMFLQNCNRPPSNTSQINHRKSVDQSNDFIESTNFFRNYKSDSLMRNTDNSMYMSGTYLHSHVDHITSMSHTSKPAIQHPSCSRSEPNASKFVSKSVLILGVYYDDMLITDTARTSPGTGQNLLDSKTTNSSLDNCIRSEWHPYISKNNYRKLLPYTDLAVTDVDKMRDELCEEHNFKSERSQNDGSKSDSEQSIMSRLIRENNYLQIDLKSESNLTPSIESTKQTMIKDEQSGAESKSLQDSIAQDYYRLETVSGSEMLLLKMRSVRAAMAVYRSDDTTSEEWDTDNTFDDDIADDNDIADVDDEQNNRKYNTTLSVSSHLEGNQLSATEQNSLEDVESGPPTSDPGEGDDGPARNILQRQGDGDGQAAELGPDDLTDTDGVVTSSNGEYSNSVEAYDVTNSDLDTSNQRLSSDHKHKSRFHTGRTQYLYSTNSSTESYHNFGISSDSNVFDSSYPAQSEAVCTGDQSLLSASATVTSLSSARAQDRHTMIAASVSFKKDIDERTNVIAPSTFLAGDERAEILARSSSAKVNNSLDPVVISDSEASDNSGTSKIVETGSTGSDTSVTIEPYGRRRPAWMDDSLLLPSSGHIFVSHDRDVNESANENIQRQDKPIDESTNENIQRQDKPIDESANENIQRQDKPIDESTNENIQRQDKPIDESTNENIQRQDKPIDESLLSNHSQNMAVADEFDFANMNSRKPKSYEADSYQSPALSRPSLEHYIFDEDIDRGFEDALEIDYNAYSSTGLCFETIAEESEGSLSESASSIGRSDSSESSIFTTPAVPSHPSSHAICDPSVPERSVSSDLRDQKHLESNQEDKSSSFTSIHFNNFPTCERTSADGSDDVSSAENVDRAGSRQRPRYSLPERTMTQENIQVTSVPTDRGHSIEQASNINSPATVFVDPSTSPWSGADTPGSNPALELSFDSDFSQLSSDSLSNSWNCSSLSVKHESPEHGFLEKGTEGRTSSSTPVDARMCLSTSPD